MNEIVFISIVLVIIYLHFLIESGSKPKKGQPTRHSAADGSAVSYTYATDAIQSLSPSNAEHDWHHSIEHAPIQRQERTYRKKTDNPYIDDDYEFILSEEKLHFWMVYTSEKGRTGEWEMDLVCITGTEDGTAHFLLATPIDTDKQLSFRISNIQELRVGGPDGRECDPRGFFQSLCP